MIELQDPESVLLVLKGMKAKIEDGWCKGWLGNDINGHYTGEQGLSRATQVCLVGAVLLQDESFPLSTPQAVDILFDRLPAYWQKPSDYCTKMHCLSAFNDATSKETVLGLLDTAIADVRIANG